MKTSIFNKKSLLAMVAPLLVLGACFKGNVSLKSPGCGPGRAADVDGNCALKDRNSPSVTLSSKATSSTNHNPIVVTATFSEVVYDLVASDVVVTNGQATNISSSDGKVYTIDIVPAKEAEVTVVIPAAVAADYAGQANAASNQLSWLYDGTPPILSFVSISRTSPDLSSTPDPTLTMGLTESSKITLYKDDTCSVSISKAADLNAGAAVQITTDVMERAKVTRIYGKAVDAAGNDSGCQLMSKYTHIMKLVDPNQSASNSFGNLVVELTNGNIVVNSPYADINGVNDAGAVYLYNGETGALISTLHGSTAGDAVGERVVALSNGNFVVASRFWDCQATLGCAGTVADVGAVTLVSGTTGLSGPVTATNSLVGSSANDTVGDTSIIALTNGNYVVRSPNWDCQVSLGCAGTVTDVGAATFGNGTTGVIGAVAASNSLIGTTASDQVGYNIVALTNGNYVVPSQFWDCQASVGCSGTVTDVGAVTFGNGTTGITGQVTASNSLIGTTANDRISSYGVTALTNGNYVVASGQWDCQLALGCSGTVVNVGAATFGNGATGVSGPVTASNSLIGTTASDTVGIGATALENGNYVVRSPGWTCQAALGCAGTVAGVGAATFGNGTTGITGQVTASNSLIGTTAGDSVGLVTALTNGNYVVASTGWDCQVALGCAGTITDAGAATFGNGTTGTTGQVTVSNSLIGTTASDGVGGTGVTALANGNYIVGSGSWDCQAALGCAGTIADVGAATLGNGTTGITGQIMASNSLIGTTATDNVGYFVTALTNGNYVVGSPNWDCQTALGCAGTVTDVGAVTFGSGTTGVFGQITASNSILGTTASDNVGGGLMSNNPITALKNGRYAFVSRYWDCQAALGCSGTVTDVGAVTWGSGLTALTGFVSANNSLFGSTASDQLGARGNTNGIRVLNNGKYAVISTSYGPSDERLVIIIDGSETVAGSI